jgi:8-oxo-dGTP pyrophosphatase MutT (NUDIX family)
VTGIAGGEMMRSAHIRPLALGIVWRGDALLACEYYDHVKDEIFYRPLGGGIDFGERSQEALRREFREELGVELSSVRYLVTLENIFTCNGQRGHEIVLLYEVTLADPTFYEQESFEVHEEGELLTARWMLLHKFQTSDLPLYPDGLLEYLMGKDVVR